MYVYICSQVAALCDSALSLIDDRMCFSVVKGRLALRAFAGKERKRGDASSTNRGLTLQLCAILVAAEQPIENGLTNTICAFYLSIVLYLITPIVCLSTHIVAQGVTSPWQTALEYRTSASKRRRISSTPPGRHDIISRSAGPIWVAVLSWREEVYFRGSLIDAHDNLLGNRAAWSSLQKSLDRLVSLSGSQDGSRPGGREGGVRWLPTFRFFSIKNCRCQRWC